MLICLQKLLYYTQFKKNDNILRLFTLDEYNQIAGKAGRRNLDTFGNVIVLPDKHLLINKEKAKQMIMAPPNIITSKMVIDPICILK